MDFTMDFTVMILKALAGSAFDVNTYIGIAVGALLARVWIAMYELIKASVLLKLPLAGILFKRLELAVRKLLNMAEPVVDIVEEKATKKKAKVDAKK